MDTSPEGRLATREVLNAIEAGLGYGETPIFPISVFQLKAGVNYNIDDPNYDLFRQACKVSAKRLFPNFVNLDAPYNLQYYKPGDYNSYVATMGCAVGSELIAYKYKGKFYCEGIKKLWLRVQSNILKRNLSNYKIPDDLEVWDGDNDFVKVKTIIKNPNMQNWVRVSFTSGRMLLVTEDHPLYTENRGRITVNELRLGDTIKTYYNLPNKINDDAITDTKLAYLLGRLVTNEITASELLKQPDFANYAENNFVLKARSEKFIPNEIFFAAREVKIAFVAGMFDGNGHISNKSKIQLDSGEHEFSLQQMALAQSLGFPAKIYINHYNPKNHDKIRYNVQFPMSKEFEPYIKNTTKIKDAWNHIESVTRAPEIIKVKNIEYIGSLDEYSYDLETVTDKFTLSFINSGNCRTRVMSNVNGAEQSGSRGNFSFVTINLPKLAIEAKGNIDEFFNLYDKYITICHDYLLFRLKTIEEKHVYNYPFLMGQGVWLGSDKLKPTDTIKEVLKHASYSIGFCGLAECLVALIGKHHGQSAEAQELGLKIVKYLRDRTDEYTKLEQRNWTTFGTPAESTAGQFQRANRKKYGRIKGVTDRNYMTNSSHVPVYFPICVNDKIQIEAPYHALENAGHIAYIEMDGDPTKNLSAFEAVVRAMHDANMGYFSINHPVDRDPVCGYTGIIANECPHCHRKESERGTFHIDRLNR